MVARISNLCTWVVEEKNQKKSVILWLHQEFEASLHTTICKKKIRKLDENKFNKCCTKFTKHYKNPKRNNLLLDSRNGHNFMGKIACELVFDEHIKFWQAEIKEERHHQWLRDGECADCLRMRLINPSYKNVILKYLGFILYHSENSELLMYEE